MEKNKAGKIRKTSKARVFLAEASLEEQNVGRGEHSELNNAHYPVGLTYLDAALRRNNYGVLTKDYTLWREFRCLEDIRNSVETFKPQFVGFSVMTMTRVSTYKAIKLVKGIDKNIKIVLGGIHPNVMYRQLLENLDIDAVCLGEGDESLVELCDAWVKGKPIDKIKGIAFRKGNNVIMTAQRELRRDLDNIPFPSYDIFMKPEIKHVLMITSRGCPNKCTFCCLDVLSRRLWRPRSPKNVAEEVEFIVKKYPWVERIEFIDDTFTLDNQRVIEICKELIRRKIKIKFQCQGRIKPVSREMFYWMEKAGFDQIGFGIETGSKKILASINKGITQEDCINALNILKEFKKLKVAKYLIVGLPGETWETVKETIEFIKKLQRIKRMEYFYASPLWVYPGTAVYELAKSKGVVDDSYWMTDKPCPLFTLEHHSGELIKMSNRIAFETMLAQEGLGMIWQFAKRVAKSPKYYLKRFITGTTNLRGFS